MRIATFIIAILLLAGSIDPTRGPLIALTVLSGLAAVRWRPWRALDVQPAVDARLVTFVLALLLLAGVIDPTRGWLIGLSVAAGLATFAPRLFRTGPLFAPEWAPFGRRARLSGRGRHMHWDGGWDGDDWR